MTKLDPIDNHKANYTIDYGCKAKSNNKSKVSRERFDESNLIEGNSLITYRMRDKRKSNKKI